MASGAVRVGLTREQKAQWPCTTCVARQGSFCAAITGNNRYLPLAKKLPIRQVHGRAKAEALIYEKGKPSEDVFVVCQGWAVRFIQLSTGRRQILSVLLPGQLVSAASLFAEELHFCVQAVTEVRFSRLARADLNARLMANPVLLATLGHVCATEHQELDELSTNLGQRGAEERVAHAIVRMVERLAGQTVGRDHRYPFPLRQRHLADMTGLTSAHVSRVMSQFRRANYLELSKGSLVLHDRAGLERIGRL